MLCLYRPFMKCKVKLGIYSLDFLKTFQLDRIRQSHFSKFQIQELFKKWIEITGMLAFASQIICHACSYFQTDTKYKPDIINQNYVV